MFAEAMTGIALVKTAVDSIKSAITTANDISSIAGDIDKLLSGEQQIQKKKAAKQRDPFSISSVAQETIDAKLAREKIDEIRQLVDFRFGHGTWQGIINERAKRIQDAKEAAEEAAREKAKKRAELVEGLTVAGGVLIGCLILAGAVFGMIYFASKG